MSDAALCDADTAAFQTIYFEASVFVAVAVVVVYIGMMVVFALIVFPDRHTTTKAVGPRKDSRLREFLAAKACRRWLTESRTEGGFDSIFDIQSNLSRLLKRAKAHRKSEDVQSYHHHHNHQRNVFDDSDDQSTVASSASSPIRPPPALRPIPSPDSLLAPSTSSSLAAVLAIIKSKSAVEVSSFSYFTSDVEEDPTAALLKDMNFELKFGSLNLLVGQESSTLLKVLGSQISSGAYSGSALINGVPLSRQTANHNQFTSFVPSSADKYCLYPSSMRVSNFLFGRGLLNGCPRDNIVGVVGRAMQLVGIGSKCNERIGDLNKLERKLLKIGEQLLKSAKILFVDLPTAELDVISSKYLRMFFVFYQLHIVALCR